MLLKVVDETHAEGHGPAFRDIVIGEGEAFLLPAHVPHNPIRYADTIGLVIERVRTPRQIDRLRWYCERCSSVVHEESFTCDNIETDLSRVIGKYADSECLRTCGSCSFVNRTVRLA